MNRLLLRLLPLSCLLATGCAADRPAAVVAADRSTHLLDRPFPSDELLTAEQTINLSDFPAAGSDLGSTFLEGWMWQAGETVRGFSQLSPVYFQLDGPPADAMALQDSYDGLEDDPVAIWSLDTGQRVPVQVRFIESSLGDPFLVDNLLILKPAPWAPLTGGERWAAGISDEWVAPAEGWIAPEGVGEGWGVATTFTTQDSLGQLRAIGQVVDDVLDAEPELLQPDALRRVASLGYEQGFTPRGRHATVVTVTFDDGGTELSYLGPGDVEAVTLDLSDDPMEVYQTTLTTLAFQDLSEQPYASAGLGWLGDSFSGEGWIDHDADGVPLRQPTPEPMRVLIQVPREGAGHSVLTWDHGTGGHAYSALLRPNPADDMLSLRQAMADAGVVIVSRDQPLYGTRFPLIDAGYSGSLGFYNITNLAAFRDNQRQGAADHHLLNRFVRQVLPSLFESGRVEGASVGGFGHSLGSVTLHLGQAMAEGGSADALFASGATASFVHAILETGLLTGGGGSASGSMAQLLTDLLGVELPDPITGQAAAGALMGVPEAGWGQVDHFHPALLPFSLIMDPSDPLVYGQHLPGPETILLGVGDFQSPNIGSRWLHQSHPDSELVECQPGGDYDPHYCLYREATGLSAWQEFAASL